MRVASITDVFLELARQSSSGAPFVGLAASTISIAAVAKNQWEQHQEDSSKETRHGQVFGVSKFLNENKKARKLRCCDINRTILKL